MAPPPSPSFRPEQQQAGYRYRISILQAELSLTQVFERPRYGRLFFEEVIRENLDLGRPDVVQLIFDRVTRSTPGSFRTRIITDCVILSLHVQYKSSRIKQYFKEGRALRTETTINNTRNLYINKGLDNLAALQQIGYQANRRLLDVQSISHDCTIGLDRFEFESVIHPRMVSSQRASGLRFGEPGSASSSPASITGVSAPDSRSKTSSADRTALPIRGAEPCQATFASWKRYTKVDPSDR